MSASANVSAVAPRDRPQTILLAAVEPSADMIGAALLEALNERADGLRFVGCGGEAMAAKGFESAFPIGDLAVIGFLDVGAVYFKAVARAKKLALLAAETEADAAVFIDGWAFSRLCATRFRKRSPRTKRLKLAAPQVWASRPQRVDFVKEYFDGVMTLLPFEAPYFEKEGVDTVFIGNPNFEAAKRARADGAAFRARHGLGDRRVIGLLPGSRRHEIKRLAPLFIEAARRQRDVDPGVALVAPLAPAIRDLAGPMIRAAFPDAVLPETEEKYDAFAAMTVALAASGTVTTELAIHKVPQIVAYRVDPITARWVRSVYMPEYVSIVNIAAGEEIFPERLQEDCTVDNLAERLGALLADPAARRRQIEEAAPAIARLTPAGPPAAARAADAVLDWLKTPRKA